jgi:hypothetical protein
LLLEVRYGGSLRAGEYPNGALFVLFRAVPELETAFVGVSGWNLRQGEGGSFFSMNMTFSATCKNRNYVPIVLPEVLIDVYHRNETYVGTVSKSDVVFPAQQDHTELLEFYIQNTSPQLVAALLLDAGTCSFFMQHQLLNFGNCLIGMKSLRSLYDTRTRYSEIFVHSDFPAYKPQH